MSKYHYFILYKYNPSSLIYNEIDCIFIYICAKISMKIKVKIITLSVKNRLLMN